MVIRKPRDRPAPASGAAPLFVFAGGGTGGHLFPALAIVAAVRDRRPDARFLFLATQRPLDARILSRAECDLIRQPLGRLDRAPGRWPRFLIGLWQSVRLCRSLFAKQRPTVVVGTGGLGCFPAVREAVRARIPTALLNPDVLPGRANRYLAGSVNVVLAQWPETVGHLPRSVRVEVTGCPVRKAFKHATRRAGLERFGLDADRKTLLVTGASQGARTVNQAVISILEFLESRGGWQVLHLTGEPDWKPVREAYDRTAIRRVVVPFTDHMADALAAADLVIARAGASSLAEIAVVGRASILMPYPHHRDHHQFVNARGLARVSAARIVPDRVDPRINGPALRAVLRPVMEDDASREAMAVAARRLGRKHAAADVAEALLQLPRTRGCRRMDESLAVFR